MTQPKVTLSGPLKLDPVTVNPTKQARYSGFSLADVAPRDATVYQTLKYLYDWEGNSQMQDALAGDKRWLKADRATTRSLFMKGFGIDPFSREKGKGLERSVFVLRKDKDGRDVPMTIPFKDLTRGEAQDLWDITRKSEQRMGNIYLDGKWVKATPENKLKLAQSRVTVPGHDIQRYKNWIDESTLALTYPGHRVKISKYLLKNPQAFPGLPLPKLKQFLRSAARAKIEDKYWLNRDGKPYMKPWAVIEAKMRAAGSSPAWIADKKELYFTQKRKALQARSNEVDAEVSAALKRLKATDILDVAYMVPPGSGPGATPIPVKRDGPLYVANRRNGWVEVHPQKKAPQPGAQRALDDHSPAAKARARALDASTVWAQLQRPMDIAKDQALRAAADKKRKAGEPLQRAWTWALVSDLVGSDVKDKSWIKATHMYGNELIEDRVMRLYKDHKATSDAQMKWDKMTPEQRRKRGAPMGGKWVDLSGKGPATRANQIFVPNWMPAYALGRAGHTNWNAFVGAKNPDGTPMDKAQFERYMLASLKKRVSKARAYLEDTGAAPPDDVLKKKIRDAQRRLRRMPSLGTIGTRKQPLNPAVARKRRALERSIEKWKKQLSLPRGDVEKMLKGWEKSLSLYARHKKSGSDKFLRNRMGMYAKVRPEDYLYAGYFGQTRKDTGEPLIRGFVGLTSHVPSSWRLDDKGKPVSMPEDTWQQAFAHGVETWASVIEDRIKRHAKRREEEPDSAIDTYLKWVTAPFKGIPGYLMEEEFGGPIQQAEKLLQMPARIWQFHTGLKKGLQDTVFNSLVWLGTAVTPGVPTVSKDKMPAWKLMSSNQFNALRKAGLKIDPEYASKLFVEQNKFDLELAKIMESKFDKKMRKHFLATTAENFDDILAGLIQLPGMLIGPGVKDQPGRTFWDRYVYAMDQAEKAGYSMSSGMGNFIYLLLKNPAKTFHAAPVDTLSMYLPLLRGIVKGGKWMGRKLDPIADAAIIKTAGFLYKHALKAGLVADATIGGGKGSWVKRVEKAQRAIDKGAIGAGLFVDRLKEMALSAGQKWSRWWDTALAAREGAVGAMFGRMKEGTPEAALLSDMKMTLVDAFENVQSPAEFRSLVEIVRDSIGTDILKRPEYAGISGLIDKALSIDLKGITPEQFVKHLDARGAAAPAAEFASLLEKALKDTPLPANWQHGAASNLKKFFEPRVQQGLIAKHTHKKDWFTDVDWGARDLVLKVLFDTSGSPVTQVVREVLGRQRMWTDPKALVSKLREIRDRIAKGEMKPGTTEWLYGKKVDLTQDNKALAGDFHHGPKNRGPDAKPDALKEKLTIDDLAEYIGRRHKKEMVGQLDNLIGAIEKGFEPLSPRAQRIIGNLKDPVWVVPDINKRFVDVPDAPLALPELSLDHPLQDITVPQLKKRFDKLAEIIRDQTGITLKPPPGGWHAAKKADIIRMLDAYEPLIAEGKRIPSLDVLIQEFYQVRPESYSRAVEALAANTKKGKSLLAEFRSTLRDHGPLAAYNRLLGSKDDAVTVDFIAKVPEVLDAVFGQKNAAKILSDLKDQVIRTAVGTKAQLSPLIMDLASELHNTAAALEGAAVHAYWSGWGGRAGDRWKNSSSGDSLTPKAMLDPDARSSIVADIVEGADGVELPGVLQVDPTLVIDNLKSVKAKLKEQAVDAGVSQWAFERNFQNAILRLRKYKRLKEEFAGVMGAQGKIVYVPDELNIGLKYSMWTQADQSKWVSFIKRNFTGRYLKSFMNNLGSSVALQFARKGKVVNPFSEYKYITMKRGMKSLDKDVRRRSRAMHDKWHASLIDDAVKKGASLDDARLIVKRKLDTMDSVFNVGEFLEAGALEIEMGMAALGSRMMGKGLFQRAARRLGNAKALKMLEAGYKFTDQGFKFEEAMSQRNFLDRAMSRLDDGDDFRIEPSEGVFLNLRKTADGADVIGVNGRVMRRLNFKQLGDALSSSAAVVADRLFINYANLPGFAAFMKKINRLGLTSPFITWAFKSMWIPGKRGGLAKMLFEPTAYFKTNNKAVNKMMSKRFNEASVRRNLAIQMGRDRLQELDPATLRKVVAFLPSDVRATLVKQMSDEGFMRVKDLSTLNPFGPTQAFFKIMKYGGNVAGRLVKKLSDLEGGEKAFEDYWMTHWADAKTSKEKEASLIMDLTGHRGEKFGYSKKGKLTDKGRNTLKLRREMINITKGGSAKHITSLIELVFLKGGPASDIVKVLNNPKGTEIHWASRVFKTLMPMMTGGTVASLVDAGIGIADKESVFSSRSNEHLTPHGEDALRYLIRRTTGLGYKTVRKDETLKDHVSRVRQSLSKNLTSGLRSALKKPGKDLTEEKRRLMTTKLERLEVIIDSEMELYKFNLKRALSLHHAAQSARKGLKREPKVSTFRVVLVRAGDKWIYKKITPGEKDVILKTVDVRP